MIQRFLVSVVSTDTINGSWIQRSSNPTELGILIGVNKARTSGPLVPSYRSDFGCDTIAHDRSVLELSQRPSGPATDLARAMVLTMSWRRFDSAGREGPYTPVA